MNAHVKELCAFHLRSPIDPLINLESTVSWQRSCLLLPGKHNDATGIPRISLAYKNLFVNEPVDLVLGEETVGIKNCHHVNSNSTPADLVSIGSCPKSCGGRDLLGYKRTVLNGQRTIEEKRVHTHITSIVNIPKKFWTDFRNTRGLWVISYISKFCQRAYSKTKSSFKIETMSISPKKSRLRLSA